MRVSCFRRVQFNVSVKLQSAYGHHVRPRQLEKGDVRKSVFGQQSVYGNHVRPRQFAQVKCEKSQSRTVITLDPGSSQRWNVQPESENEKVNKN